jgi:hypothetical protein
MHRPARAASTACRGRRALASTRRQCNCFFDYSSACLLDLDGVIVDGAMHGDLLDKLLDEVRAALGRYSWQGVMRPEVQCGMIGADAKVTGAAYLPLHANFASAHDLFLKLVK